MTHGIGPQNNVRSSLKELHSAIEEAKADVTGLFMLQQLYDEGLLPAEEETLYTTFLASTFRTLRFGVRDLVHDLLTIEATGDYAGAKAMLDELGVLQPTMESALARLADLPTDIEPVRP